MEDLLTLLTDAENQPHQYVGDKEALREELFGRGRLEIAIREAENGFEVQQHGPTYKLWVFQNSEDTFKHLMEMLNIMRRDTL